MIIGLLLTVLFQYLKCQAQRISKNLEALSCSAVHEISEGVHFLHLAFQGGDAHPYPPVTYATDRRYLEYNNCIWSVHNMGQ